jgi:hypothetical protein
MILRHLHLHIGMVKCFGNPKGIAIIQPGVARNELRRVVVQNK